MATLFTHALVGGTLGWLDEKDRRSLRRFTWVAALCSMLPDVDVIGFRLGVPYSALWGHRGFTHSLLFAALAATAGVFFAGKAAHSLRPWFVLFVVTASHGVLDAMTNGGLGVAFFSPFDTTRYFLSWRPIAVSPIGLGRLASFRMVHILWTEVVWVWLPLALIAILTGLVRARAGRFKLDRAT